MLPLEKKIKKEEDTSFFKEIHSRLFEKSIEKEQIRNNNLESQEHLYLNHRNSKGGGKDGKRNLEGEVECEPCKKTFTSNGKYFSLTLYFQSILHTSFTFSFPYK